MSMYQSGQWGSWDHPHVMDGGPIQHTGGQYQTGPYVGPSLGPMGPGTSQVIVPTGQTIDPTTGQPVSTGQTTTAPIGTASSGFDFSSLTSMTIMGIPVLYIGIGILAYFLFFKKGR